MDLDKQLDSIRRAFAPAIGEVLTGFSTTEHRFEDGVWHLDPNLPIRLVWGSQVRISVSWSRFDDLWLATDDSMPFKVDMDDVRWVSREPQAFRAALGSRLKGVLLGQGEFSIEGKGIEIWTRLVIETEACWLEIFNALDENGYSCHAQKPEGTFLRIL